MDVNLVGFLSPSTLWAIFQMVLGLGAVIFVHELGHFLVAKACGVKCEKFYLGFDAFDIKIGDRVLIPRRLVHWTWGETEYGVGILPLGGYVKMLGQDDNPQQMAEERERSIQDSDDPNVETKLDPRSYQAKSVPQRMAIISAGVIMNLIFAVIFAAIAFGTGVNYEPPVVGATTPGSPAWEHDLDGATLLSIGGESTRNKYFTFGHMAEAIIFEGGDEPIEMSFLPAPSADQLSSQPTAIDATQPRTLSIQPAKNLIEIKGAKSLPAIGVQPTGKAVLVGTPPALEGQAAALADPPLESGDKIIAVNGKSIVQNLTDENGKPYTRYSLFLLQKLLSQNQDQTVELTVEREGSEQGTTPTSVVCTLPPNPMRTIGLTMKIGPIEGIQIDSPAAKAGLQKGDLIKQIDGLPLGDPFTLQQRMAMLAREKKTAVVSIERKEGSNTRQLEIEVQPRLPRRTTNFGTNRPIDIDSLGIVFPVTNEVLKASDIAGDTMLEIQPGDHIMQVKFVLDDEQQELFSSDTVDLEEHPKSWAHVNFLMQRLKPGTQMELTVVSSKETSTYTAKVLNYKGYFQETRGFNIATEQMPYQAQSVWEAITLGARQTWLDATKVLRFLGKLVKGEIPITGLGGPGTIVMAATSEASQGTPRLLLFLTLLSANLAIINFLPIPILDGGHMVFLFYEGIFRRPVSERLQYLLSISGLIFIVGLMLLVISLDVWRWSGLF